MKHTMHDPSVFALPYPRNLILAIAKADLIDPETKELKSPIVEVNEQLEEFVKTYIPYELTETELRVIRKHYVEHQSLIDIASSLDCTSENVRVTRNKALNKILKCYLVATPGSIPEEFSHIDIRIPHAQYDPSRVPLAELKPDPPSEYMFKDLFDQIDTSLHDLSATQHQASDPLVLPEQLPRYIKPAKNSIKTQVKHPHKRKGQIPYKFYIRSDGALYVELKEETNMHYIGEFYNYSNATFSIEGIIVDISIAGILLTDWEVKHK